MRWRKIEEDITNDGGIKSLQSADGRPPPPQT